MTRVVVALVLAGQVLAAPAVAKKKKPAPEVKAEAAEDAAGTSHAAPEDPAVLRAELREGSEARGIEAARKLAEDPSPAALEVVLDELAVGAPPKVQLELLGALAGRKDPRAFELLSLYTQNRNAGVRKKAVVVLAELPEARVMPLLVGALSDSVSEVRAAAARALLARNERTPVVEEALVKLLMHQDAAAVEALGAVGGPTTARRLGELVGQLPDPLLAGVFSEMLRRADFGPDPIRVEVVKTVGKLTGPEATQTLRDYVASTENDKTRPSRGEAQKLIEQRGAN